MTHFWETVPDLPLQTAVRDKNLVLRGASEQHRACITVKQQRRKVRGKVVARRGWIFSKPQYKREKKVTHFPVLTISGST